MFSCAVFIWTVCAYWVFKYVCLCLRLHLGLGFLSQLWVHSFSSQTFGSSIVLQMTCLIKLQSSFNSKNNMFAILPSRKIKTVLSRTVLAELWAEPGKLSNPCPASYATTRLLVRVKLCRPRGSFSVTWATADPFPLASSHHTGNVGTNVDRNSAAAVWGWSDNTSYLTSIISF